MKREKTVAGNRLFQRVSPGTDRNGRRPLSDMLSEE